jgi:hypothetical protein
LRRTLTILLVSLLHAGCSTCSMWDECEPGDERTCSHEGCGDCVMAQETCRDNHEWGPCHCVEWEEDDDFGCGGGSWRRDTDDPEHDESLDWTWEDIAFDLPLDEELDPGTDEDEADAEDVDDEDVDAGDVDDEDVDDEDVDAGDAPEDAGES